MKELPSSIDFNDDFRRAFQCLEHGNSNLFITGKAGTGKSTLLQYFRDNASKRAAVIAPTGVAALNVQGQTIHSFFQFQPNITQEQVHEIQLSNNKKSMFKSLDMIIIDEISMVRADLLDCIDEFLRIYGKDVGVPFGGVRMVFFGDLYQLPPVVTREDGEALKRVYNGPYFFDSQVFKHFRMDVFELKRIYRQKDPSFIDLLNKVRNNFISHSHLQALNKRCDPLFEPTEDDFYVYLTTTNSVADNINRDRLDRLNTKVYYFTGEVKDQFPYKNLPTDKDLELKIGSQIMLVNNDSGGLWVNGSIGKITNICEKENSKTVEVKLSTGEVVCVGPYTWDTYRYFFNEEKKSLDSEIIGSFTQHPLRLSWAMTIHKSQGKTFPKSIIDIGWGTFCHGQLYVALSRCTSLNGLVLKKHILKKHIIVDGRVVNFMNKHIKRGGKND